MRVELCAAIQIPLCIKSIVRVSNMRCGISLPPLHLATTTCECADIERARAIMLCVWRVLSTMMAMTMKMMQPRMPDDQRPARWSCAARPACASHGRCDADWRHASAGQPSHRHAAARCSHEDAGACRDGRVLDLSHRGHGDERTCTSRQCHRRSFAHVCFLRRCTR